MTKIFLNIHSKFICCCSGVYEKKLNRRMSFPQDLENEEAVSSGNYNYTTQLLSQFELGWLIIFHDTIKITDRG